MEKITKVIVFTFGFILMIFINVFLSIFHLFMRKKSETHQRLLNILYSVLAFTIQVININKPKRLRSREGTIII